MNTVILLTAAFSAAAAQCTGNDSPSCPAWNANGYCNNAGMPQLVREKYCGVLCGLCTRDGRTVALRGTDGSTPCENDANANCANWQAQNGFCTNPVTSTAMKLQYCCRTCRPYIFGTTTTTTTTTTTAAPPPCPPLGVCTDADIKKRFGPTAPYGSPTITPTRGSCSAPTGKLAYIDSTGNADNGGEFKCVNNEWVFDLGFGSDESLKATTGMTTTKICCYN
ncbi:hypothetical protein PMAYCL1PPCAC_21452 [Pristionchus mayeri]|uniref:ShKT domain-containing protein n=1 Tax=Pristionchus mayeri TaxID=1317129 RepID=A0AAN5CVB8_9BILA|nr:hypothetical protein PMAYCL1PPCAC_21452 [Pristionchus mayeri]